MRYIVAIAVFLLSACTPAVSRPRPTTTLESFFQRPTEEEPAGVPVIAELASPMAPPSVTARPSASRTPTPAVLWVCADLAFGREAPSADSPVVFQMSERDGWKVQLQRKEGDWYQVRAGDMGAWMLASDLCETPRPTPAPTPMPRATVAPPTAPPPPRVLASPTFANIRVGAICNDGTSSGATGSGACSHHGGVRQWLYR